MPPLPRLKRMLLGSIPSSCAGVLGTIAISRETKTRNGLNFKWVIKLAVEGLLHIRAIGRGFDGHGEMHDIGIEWIWDAPNVDAGYIDNGKEAGLSLADIDQE